LPLEFLEDLVTFRFYLNDAGCTLFELLREATPASPPLRKLFTRYPLSFSNLLTPPRAVISREMIPKQTKVESQLLRPLELLGANSPCVHYLGMSRVLDGLEHILLSEPEATSSVSSHWAKFISDASIVAQCRTQLDRFQPWARTFELAAMDRMDALSKKYEVWNQTIRTHFTPKLYPWRSLKRPP
jgi:hypothetical protein